MSSSLPLSSSNSPPSLRTSPFSVLPPELVHHIVESTANVQTHSYDYISRQSTLASLCLTSKLFFQIAQPLLYETAYLTTRNDFDNWDRFRETGRIKTRDVILQYDLQGFNLDHSDLTKMAQNHPQIDELTLSCATIDLNLVSNFTNLNSLVLNCCDIFTTGPFEFRKLENLDINQSYNKPDTTIEMFERQYFPVLKSITWTGSWDFASEERWSSSLVHNLFLASTVKLVSMDQAYEDLIDIRTQNLEILKEKTIFDIWRSGQQLLGQLMQDYSYSQCFKYCRMSTVEDLDRETEDLSIVTNVLNSLTRPIHLKLFYLFTSDITESKPLKEAVDSLRSVCKRLGIELIWRKREATFDYDSFTRKDLARRLGNVE
ncbi:hypothetical protein JCM5350_001263 [Sporobolomyces pararoseus]